MPLFLLPFIVLAAGNTKMHKQQTEAAMMAGDRSPEDALPYARYLFLWHISPRGRPSIARSPKLACSPVKNIVPMPPAAVTPGN